VNSDRSKIEAQHHAMFELLGTLDNFHKHLNDESEANPNISDGPSVDIKDTEFRLPYHITINSADTLWQDELKNLANNIAELVSNALGYQWM
jgi:hypothetical protein